MLSRIISWIANYLTKLVDGWATDQQITGDKEIVNAKKAEADVKLKELSDLGVLKTSAANEAADLTKRVAVDDAAVAKADDATKSAVERIAAIKTKKGVTQKDFLADLDKVKLDD